MKRIITLLTDFGIKDPYVAQMKGVILSINAEAQIIDISHEVSKHNIHEAAFILLSTYSKFPKRSIHVVVVDPGVGTRRKAIVVETRRYLFVGPDNGVLSLAVDDDGVVRAYEIKNPLFLRSHISSTFHGRDIFAPVAAYLSLGIPPEYVGPEIDFRRIKRIAEPKALIIDDKTFRACVIYIDNFGNVITNIKADMVPKGVHNITIKFKDKELTIPFKRAYNDVPKGEVLSLIDSFNYLEVAVNQGNAAKRLGLSVGDSIVIEFS